MKKDRKQLEVNRNSIYLLILLSVGTIIGAYLIATTTIIAKDGAFYIDQAKSLDNDPLTVIQGVAPGYPMKGVPPGYPILIWVAHKLLRMISEDTSIFGWIWCGQFLSLLSRA